MKATGEAKDAVLDQLGHAYERWAETEQLLRAQGDAVEAEGAHVLALRLLRAYQGESDDPIPDKGPA